MNNNYTVLCIWFSKIKSSEENFKEVKKMILDLKSRPIDIGISSI